MAHPLTMHLSFDGIVDKYAQLRLDRKFLILGIEDAQKDLEELKEKLKNIDAQIEYLSAYIGANKKKGF